MSTPLYKLKGEFFKTLGHPARIRVLELLVDGERSVSQLIPDVGLEASHLSQQLGVLRRAGVVRARKQGNEVIYSLTSPAVAELMRVARAVLAGILSDQTELLEDLVADEAQARPGRKARSGRTSTGRSGTARTATIGTTRNVQARKRG